MALNHARGISVFGVDKGSGVNRFAFELASLLSGRAKVLIVSCELSVTADISESFNVPLDVKTVDDLLSNGVASKALIEGYLFSGVDNLGFVEWCGCYGESVTGVLSFFSTASELYDHILFCFGKYSGSQQSLVSDFIGRSILFVSSAEVCDKSAKKVLKEYLSDDFSGLSLDIVLDELNGRSRDDFKSLLGIDVSLVFSSVDEFKKYAERLATVEAGDGCSPESLSDFSLNRLKGTILEDLSSSDDVKDLLERGSKNGDLREVLSQKIEEVLDDDLSVRPDAKPAIIVDLLDEMVGLGPIERYMCDPDITEIMVNSRDRVYVEVKGLLQRVDVKFLSDKSLMKVIERIVEPLGRRIDESSPMVDARLPDGSRVHAIIPPLAIDGPVLTIRKFSGSFFSLDTLLELGALSPGMAALLRESVEGRLTILVSGGTGSGKTTMLNVLSQFVSPDERIVTIEDSAELSLKQPHVVRLESRPPNLEGNGEVSIRDLVKTSLRMRPDRIIVGECRGGEAIDMLQAMNTGHDGSMTTIHANSPRDSISRLETLVMFSGFDLPSRAIREQIVSAIDMVVHVARVEDGKRKVVGISEITGLEGDVVTMQELYGYRAGEFSSTGFRPRCFEK